MIEFVLAGIPALFILISTVQMGLGMWEYHTLDSALQQAGRYIAVRGRGCTQNGNTCSVSIGTIAQQIATFAIALPPGGLNVTLTPPGGAATVCNPLNTCNANATIWPASPYNAPGMIFTITGTFTWSPIIGMVWPGTVQSTAFHSYTLGASTAQEIMF
ncbi:MAG TPA: TadE family protein [Bryobacteraceae bacterium]|nr:TadE family protein [Bryobacteraceae bacterium]